MKQQLDIILDQMIVFVVLLTIGAIAAKAKVLTGNVLDSLAKIVVNITLPALIITLVPSAGGREVLLKAFPMLLCSYLLILFLFSIGKLTGKIGGLKSNTYDIHTAETAFGNVGFMGIPLIQALFGQQGIFYISIFSIADHSLLWTLGTYLSSGKKEKNILANIKRIVNPTTMALLTALILVALDIKPGGVVNDTVTGLGNTSKYLSLVYIGGTLISVDFKNILKRWTIFLVVIFKMILAPIAVYLLASMAKSFLSHEAVMTLTIVAMLPSMVTIAILARVNGSDDKYASECIFVTTLMSLITIPFVMWILSML